MNRSSRLAAHGLIAAIMILAGIGLYSHTLSSRLAATQASFSALEQDRNLWKSKAERAEGVIDSAAASLNQCSAQVDDLKSRLAMTPPYSPTDPRS